MDGEAKKATFIGIAGNVLLFAAKLTVGLISGSIALISEAVNSFTDILSATVVRVCVGIAQKKADKSHPFGHYRVEPIAGLVVALLAGVLGIEVINYAVRRIISHELPMLGMLPLAVLAATIVVKAGMAAYFFKAGGRINSPGIKAMAVDCRNDVLIASAAIIGVGGNVLGVRVLDPLAGIAIGLYVIWQGYAIGKENIDYLTGRAPPPSVVEKIRHAAQRVKGVKGVHEIRAHYVGSFVQVQLHVRVSKDLHTKKSHAIGKEVERAVESIPGIQKAFVHIDPV